MLRNAWYAYGKAYSLENLKRMWNFSSIWLFVYFLVFVPMTSLLEGDGKELGMYYFRALPLIFMMLNMGLVPLTMPKKMFLCPMDKSERKEYVVCLFWIKVLAPVVVTVVLSFIEMILFRVEKLYLLSILTSVFAANFSMCLLPQLSAGEKRKKGWDNLIIGVKPIWNMLNMILGVMQVVLIMFMEKYEITVPVGMGIYLGISNIIQILLCIFIWKKNMPCIIGEATDYEICFRILKISEKNALNKG